MRSEACAGVPLLHERIDAGAADLDHRELRRDEKAVQKHQNED